jgi:exosortase/archaeosortase
MFSFEIAHNVIGKAGSLIALIVLLFITFKILPELYDEIMGIIDLPKRKGPVELFLGRLLRKKT